jgi:signal transduction histidine kinase
MCRPYSLGGSNGLILNFADTGEGISPHLLKRIYEPFFAANGIGATGRNPALR